MGIRINDRACSADTGDLLVKVAQRSQSHVGYVCAGNGICQTCYVTVLEGMDLLSPLSDVEKAFLSERQITSGGRLACQARLVKEGTLRILSRPEEVRRMFPGNPLGLISYGADMGNDTLSQIMSGVGNVIARVTSGELKGGGEAFGELKDAVGAFLQLVARQLPESMPFGDQLRGLLGALPAVLPFDFPLLSVKTAAEPLVSVKISTTSEPVSLP